MSSPAVVAVVAPRDAGPGERQQMLDEAHQVLAEAGVEQPARIDVPASGGDEGSGQLRAEIESLVPALQSGSLFGGVTGVLLVDAQHLLAAEAQVVAELVQGIAPGSLLVVTTVGRLPAPLAAAIKGIGGKTVAVKKVRERDASEWLGRAARERHLRLHGDAAAVLLARFGTDLASMAQALDQLAASGEEVSAEAVQARFRNRPEAPSWHYADAVAAGDEGEALRRLADFLTHSHPLQLLAFMAGELRRRALAAAAPDIDTYAEWVGSRPDAYPVIKAWRARGQADPDELRRSIQALSRADLTLKTAPEAMHRVTLERLTVALCRWIGRPSRRAG